MNACALTINGLPLARHAPLSEGMAVEMSALPPPGATLALTLAGVTLEPFLRPGDPAWRWRWTLPHAAGAYALSLVATWPDGQRDSFQTQIHVAPRKLDAHHYALLLDDLQQAGRALCLALHGATHAAHLVPAADVALPAEELHSLFGAELAQLEAAVTRLARRPPEVQRTMPHLQPPGQLRDFSLLHQLPAGAPDGSDPTLPWDVLPEPSYNVSYASYEAQLLRRLLDELLRRLTKLEPLLAHHPTLHAQLQQARNCLTAMRSQPFLADLPPLAVYRGATQRLRHDPEYRAVHRYWRRLRARPLLIWDDDDHTFQLPLATLPRLYERWTLVRVVLSLMAVDAWQLEAQTLLHPHSDDWLLTLPEDAPLLLMTHANGTHVQVRYQARYTPTSTPFCTLDRHTRIPDISIELLHPHQPPAMLILDAKYRLDAAGGLPEEALSAAYSYLGAIGTPDGKRATLGVALLYPGSDPAQHYASGVAAIPLLPGASFDALAAWLRDGLAPSTLTPPPPDANL